MSSYWARALVALVLAGFLWMQARGVPGRPKRQRAFQLAAAALLVFSALNASLALGFAYEALQVALGIGGTALFVAALVALFGSVRAGEAAEQREKISAAAREYREQRERERDQR